MCGAKSLDRVQKFGGFSLFRCVQCGIEHWSPISHPGATFYEGEQVAIYRDLHAAKDRPDDPRFAKFFREVPGLRGLRVLDVGCSDGAFLSRLEQVGNECWGFDIDTKALAVARARGLTNVRRAEVPEFVEAAQKAGLTFDLITAFDVIEHLADPATTLRSLSTLLVPGGRFVGTVPNRRRLLANAMPIDFPPHHLYRYDEQALGQLLTRSGLGPLRIEAFQYNYVMVTALAAALRTLRGVRRPARVAASNPESPPRTSGARQAIARSYVRLTTPLSYLLEVPKRRGFKLYFLARKAT